MLKGSLVNFNVERRALTVVWSGLYLYNATKEAVYLGNVDDENSIVFPYGIETYRDLSSVPYNVTYTWHYDNQTYWDWSYGTDNITAKPIGVIGMHVLDSFDTDITFTQKR
ncbi:hypothetical protein FRC19_010528 [Serendipita sp. 401]|nr:hypothetical protein FRC18_001723 [Serendipita sp. 400]KAG8825765.1 hypothetical protein FRC19_010528 [Serendipita sp. 401]KAG9046939.1 hypothetical protein FS842_000744 [Serendipita sp. 407]